MFNACELLLAIVNHDAHDNSFTPYDNEIT